MPNATAFIGRFQPLHMGHMAVLDQAFEHSDRVVVAIGSARSPRTPRNPFTFAERAAMITDSVGSERAKRLSIVPLDDMIYNDEQWIEQVHTKIFAQTGLDTDVSLIGHYKDGSSYYLNRFPNWASIPVKNYLGLDATVIRNQYFSNIGHMYVRNLDGHKLGDPDSAKLVPTPVKLFLEQFLDTNDYKYVAAEGEHYRKYKMMTRFVGEKDGEPGFNFAPIFVTVDACVIQSGHILLGKRRYHPGKGLWAMPGGFLNQYEHILDATIRELREETRIKVPPAVLFGNVVTTRQFSDPYRSERGRTITFASLIHLKEGPLPAIRGDDDIEEAKWEPLAQLNPELMFEDHYSIIQNLTGLV